MPGPGAARSGTGIAMQSGASVVPQAAFGMLCTAVRASYYAAGAAVGMGVGLFLVARRRS